MIYPSRAQTITYSLISALERVLSKRWNSDFPQSGNPSFHRTKRGYPVQEGNYFSTTERTQPRAKQKTLAVAKEGAMKSPLRSSRRGWIKFAIFVAQIAEHSKV